MPRKWWPTFVGRARRKNSEEPVCVSFFSRCRDCGIDEIPSPLTLSSEPHRECVDEAVFAAHALEASRESL
jgi:hypothetical protein